MKASELKEMKELELNKRLADLKQELFNLRFQHAVSQLDNPQRIVEVKRDIARVKTVMHERNLQEAVVAADVPVLQDEEDDTKKGKKAAKEEKKAAKDEKKAAKEEKPKKGKKAVKEEADEEEEELLDDAAEETEEEAAEDEVAEGDAAEEADDETDEADEADEDK